MAGSNDPVGVQFLSHEVAVFPELWAQLKDRLDQNIGIQECLAVILGCFAWFEDLAGVAITIYVDNEAVRYSLIKGTSKSPEVAAISARFCQLVATQRWGVLIRRVESKANVADGPFRKHWDVIREIHVEWARPVMPRWVFDLWGYFGPVIDLSVLIEV